MHARPAGVGIVAVQIAKSLGAHVTDVCSTAASCGRCSAEAAQTMRRLEQGRAAGKLAVTVEW